MVTKRKTKPKTLRMEEEGSVNRVLPEAIVDGIVCLEGNLYYIDNVLDCGLVLRLPGSNVGVLYLNEIWEHPGRKFQLYLPV